MAIQILLISIFAASVFLPLSLAEKSVIPKFAFAWLNNDATFVAGEVATIKVIVLGSFEASKYEYPFNPNITANDKTGNSSYVSGVSSQFGDDVNSWVISFIPIMAGLFNVLITDDHFDVFDSSLHFRTIPGFDFSYTLD